MGKDDAGLAAAALRKQQAQERPTKPELAALKRWKKARDERERDRYYAECPKGVYLEMAETTAKVVIEHAERHSLPLLGRTVDLRAVIGRFHAFIKENRFKLAADDDPLMSGDGGSESLEEYRKWKAKLAELDYYQRLGNWIPREDVHAGLGECASILRRCGETLQRQFGPDALDVMRGALEEFRAVILVRFAEPNEQTDDDNGNETKTSKPKAAKKRGRTGRRKAGKRARKANP